MKTFSKLAGMTYNRYSTLRTKKAFRDAQSPIVNATDIEVLEYVKRTRSAVGYLSSVPLDKGLVIVGRY